MAEDHLLATHAALMEFAPHLKHHVEEILRQRSSVSETDSAEKSAHAKFPVTLKASDAQDIVEALKIIEDNEGYDKTFNNRSINLLVAAWSWQARKLQNSG
jgi:hypothetical protein